MKFSYKCQSLSCVQLIVTPTDCSPSDSSVHGILQARILESESESEVVKSCPTLCDPMDCNLPGSSVHGIFQVRVLEWVAISFSRGSSQPKDQTRVPRIADRCFTVLLQGIFPTHGSNPGLLHCRQILYCLNHQGSLCKVFTAAAAAKSLQSCPTLCTPVPGILQARTLEWVAISFSSA